MQHSFFLEGGEMGKRIRAKEWGQKPIGPVSLWPQSLRTILSMLLNSKFPMFLFWGNDSVCFYNDAYRPILGSLGKHPAILGENAAEAFPETWHLIHPIIQNIRNGGEASWHEDQTLSIYRNEKMEEVYWTSSYSAVTDESGKPGGVLMICGENTVTEDEVSQKKVEDAEERARLAAEIAEIATWELDLQSHAIIHSVNLAVIFGHDQSVKLSHSQILGQLDPEDRIEIVEKAFEVAMRTGIYKYEARVNKMNGEVIWIRSHGKIFFDDNNEPLKMIGTLIDITEERNRREILIKSEQKFRLLANSMPQHVWTADHLGDLNYFNKSVFDFSGLTQHQLQHGGWLEIVHPDEREENVRQWIHSVASGENFLFEHRFRKHDGEYRWQLSRAIAQKDHAGNIQMWVGTSTDIQDQKMFTNLLEKQVHERTAELENKNADLIKMNIELESFAHVSSHDLQEPLRKILTFISRIEDTRDSNLSGNTLGYVSKISAVANRMQDLIHDLMDYSRTKSAERVFTKVNLNDIAKEIKNDFREAIEETGAVIEADDLCEATVIPFQFRQLLHNLIGNSLKFARAGVTPRIIVKTERLAGEKIKDKLEHPERRHCHISVTDNGIGFDNEYSEGIFKVFKRLHSKEEYSGTGIGLAIVKKIVENHDGIIVATGVKNEGCRFDIYIPELRIGTPGNEILQK